MSKRERIITTPDLEPEEPVTTQNVPKGPVGPVGPKYVLLGLQDTMEPATTQWYYAKHDLFTPADLDAMQAEQSDESAFCLFDPDEGTLMDGWTSLRFDYDGNAVRAFTQDHWCHVILTYNE